eukprot:6873912-Pyramimonas_sp.AAC.2
MAKPSVRRLRFRAASLGPPRGLQFRGMGRRAQEGPDRTPRGPQDQPMDTRPRGRLRSCALEALPGWNPFSASTAWGIKE